VLTHTKFQKVEFCLSVFHRNTTNLISFFFRPIIGKNKISKIKEKNLP